MTIGATGPKISSATIGAAGSTSTQHLWGDEVAGQILGQVRLVGDPVAPLATASATASSIRR